MVAPVFSPHVEGSWNITKVQGIEWSTIVTRSLKSDAGVPYCLDSGTGEQGSKVSISECYPSPSPLKNRDPAQRWIAFPDATFRPFTNTQLCLTTDRIRGGNDVFLGKCNDGVQQHFAYHGEAPGNKGGGYLFFGDALNGLGVVNANTSASGDQFLLN